MKTEGSGGQQAGGRRQGAEGVTFPELESRMYGRILARVWTDGERI